MYFLQSDKRDTPHAVCEARTLERSLAAECCYMLSALSFGLRGVDNPMLDIKVDMYRYV